MKQPSKARPWLTPLVPLYRLGLALEELQLRTGLKPVRRLRWPVVSIGNLSTGGAGKTPLTIALAQALVRRGLRVDVLSRGYGRRSALPLPVDPRGTAEEFGDEPLLIAREAGVPVYVADERYQAGLLAENSEQLPGGLHLLDDGFQHRQLHRDVDILLLNRQDWKDSLLPAGNLREPIRAAHRAGVIAIPSEDGELEAELKTSGWQGSIWRVRRRMEVPAVDGPVAAFCGIARPEQFFDGLESGGLRIAARIPFPDHHRYTARDMDRLVSAARTAGAAAFVTTEKDRVRLGELAAGFSELIPLKTAGLRIEIEDEGPTVDSLADQVRLMQRPHRGS
jgi:tetraacyldisaccharide 4'-kinase